MNSAERPVKYNLTAIILHWVMVILLITLFCLGWYMEDLTKGSPERSWFFALHKSIGLTAALLALFRLIWRLLHSPPALPSYIPAFKQKLVRLVHQLLYLMIFIQPLSGYISSSFSGYKTKIWGIPLPHWGWKSPELNELFTNIHAISSVILLSLIALHLAGVFSHLYRHETDILKRMIPGKKQEK